MSPLEPAAGFERLTVAGHDLRLRRAPNPGAPALLLTNAWPQTIRCWDRQWDALAERYELIAVDLPGFGLSSGTPDVMRPSAQAAVLRELLDRLGVEAPVLVAPDVGVPVALSLAANHPGAVSGLVLFDGPSDYPPDVSWEGRLLYRSAIARRLMSVFGIPFTLETLRRGYSAASSRPARRAIREYLRAAASPRRFGLTLHYLGSYAEELPRAGEGWPGVDVPVLVTWGLDDPFLAPANGERLARALPNAVWRPLAGVSHYSHEDAGDRFLSMLDEWIAESVPREPEPVSGH
jgi:pimeloyl-ACP methyl ester carboxylesterase